MPFKRTIGRENYPLSLSEPLDMRAIQERSIGLERTKLPESIQAKRANHEDRDPLDLRRAIQSSGANHSVRENPETPREPFQPRAISIVSERTKLAESYIHAGRANHLIGERAIHLRGENQVNRDKSYPKAAKAGRANHMA